MYSYESVRLFFINIDSFNREQLLSVATEAAKHSLFCDWFGSRSQRFKEGCP